MTSQNTATAISTSPKVAANEGINPSADKVAPMRTAWIENRVRRK